MNRRAPESLMGKAVLKLIEHDAMTTEDFKRCILSVCDTKDQAQNLVQEMRARGMTERRVVFTDRMRAHAEVVRSRT